MADKTCALCGTPAIKGATYGIVKTDRCKQCGGASWKETLPPMTPEQWEEHKRRCDADDLEQERQDRERNAAFNAQWD